MHIQTHTHMGIDTMYLRITYQSMRLKSNNVYFPSVSFITFGERKM